MQGFEAPQDNRELPIEVRDPSALFDVVDNVHSENTGVRSTTSYRVALESFDAQTSEEQKEYARLGLSDPKTESEKTAEATMFERNLSLAAFIVDGSYKYERGNGHRQYRSPYGPFPLSLLERADRLQEAGLSLLKALRKYDGSTRLSTYAVSKIDGDLRRSLMNAPLPSGMRLPTNVQQDLQSIYASVHDRDAIDVMQVTEDTGLEPEQVLDRIEIERQHSSDAMDVDSPEVTTDKVFTYEDTTYDQTLDRMALVNVMKHLKGQRALVIAMRYGFAGFPMTCQEVADALGISRQRANQIEKEALKELRQPQNIEKLSDVFMPSHGPVDHNK